MPARSQLGGHYWACLWLVAGNGLFSWIFPDFPWDTKRDNFLGWHFLPTMPGFFKAKAMENPWEKQWLSDSNGFSPWFLQSLDWFKGKFTGKPHI